MEAVCVGVCSSPEPPFNAPFVVECTSEGNKVFFTKRLLNASHVSFLAHGWIDFRGFIEGFCEFRDRFVIFVKGLFFFKAGTVPGWYELFV